MILSVPKGRIFEIIYNFFKKKKIKIFNKKKRKLLFKTNKKNFLIAPMKNNDIGFYMKNNKVEASIIGSDMYEENNMSYKKIKINIFKCRLSLISKNNFECFKNYYSNKKIIVYTKYKNFSNKIFKRNKNIIIKKLTGNLEISIKLGICDFIADIIETGNTIIENNLYELEKLKKIYSYIIFNKKIKNNDFIFLKNIFKND
ncbi:ATP phosphoribosyltransferase [Candidatus Vidania fulgoroideorum]